MVPACYLGFGPIPTGFSIGLDQNWINRKPERTAWADWATLVADEPLAGYALTVDMDEVWHAALRRTRKNFSFMSRLTGGRFIHHEPADNYGSPDKIRQTMAALVAAGYGAAPEVYLAAVGASCTGSDCRPAAPCPGSDVAPAFDLTA